MNNEPVAWMLVTGHGTKILEKKPDCEVDYWKPLYTHPVKELTDEEMMKVEYEFLTWNRSLDKPLVEISYELGVFKQAVEILRKASEK